MSRTKWWRMPPTFRITDGEYDANVRGMNILFGAVLGFVLADASDLAAFDFGLVLLRSASVVVMILYLAQSEYKLFYLISTAAAIAALPFVQTDVLGVDAIPQLQPTLAVWAMMVVVVEMMPRQRATKPEEEDPIP